MVTLVVGLTLHPEYSSIISPTGIVIAWSGAAVVAVSGIAYSIANYLQFGTVIVTQKTIPQLSARPAIEAEDETRILEFRKRTGGAPPQGNRAPWLAGKHQPNFGTITTIFGVGVLWYVVFVVPDVDPSDHWRYVIHFVMRLSIAVLIETFAYFFLRPYRGSLEDIKYYQNELANIELRWSALRAAIDTAESMMKIAIEAMAKTERNAILKKGETTIGLERDRMDKNEIIELLRASFGIAQRTKRDGE